MTDSTGKNTGNAGRANLQPPWQKGGPSPNPGGRPKMSPEVKEWIELHGGAMDVLALNALKRAMQQGKYPAVAVKASEVWLARRLPPMLDLFTTEGSPLAGVDWTKVPTEKLKVLRDLARDIAAAQRSADSAG